MAQFRPTFIPPPQQDPLIPPLLLNNREVIICSLLTIILGLISAKFFKLRIERLVILGTVAALLVALNIFYGIL